MRNKTIISLVLIIFLAAVLRFNQLAENPPSLNLDEVAIGYNAYSILKTGRDEYGLRLPLAFRSHDDYKPPLYIYLTVFSVAVFGLNEIGVRFPSAMAGTLSILVFYFLIKELLYQKEAKVSTWSTQAALASCLLLALNPWHLQFSRAGFETNLAALFILLAVWAFLKGARIKKSCWLVSAVFFSLSLYTYQAARLFVPCFLLALFLLYFKELKKNLQWASKSLFLFILISAPLLLVIFSPAGLLRYKGTSVFEHPGLLEQEVIRSRLDLRNNLSLTAKLFHNRYFASFLTLVGGYLYHLRPDLLFLGITGPGYNYTPGVGLFYLFELPLIFIGFYQLFQLPSKHKYLLLSFIILSPLPAALTWDIPSSTRTFLLLFGLEITAALGLLKIWKADCVRKHSSRLVLQSIIILVIVFSFLHYLHQNYVHAPWEYSAAWQYGYKEAVDFARAHENEYEKIIVSTNLKQPQNFFSFYLAYNPHKYIFTDGGTVSGGFLETSNKFGKYEFHPLDYQRLSPSSNLLLIDVYEKVPSVFQAAALKVINLKNGEPALLIMESKI